MATPENPKFDPEKVKNPATKTVETSKVIDSKTEVDKKPGLEGVTQEINKSFPETKDKQIFNEEFSKSIKDKLSQFSESFKKTFCDDKGKPDMEKIFAIMGLSSFYQKINTSPTSTPKTSESAKTSPEVTKITTGKYQPKFDFDPSSKGAVPERPANSLTGAQFLDEMNSIGKMPGSKTNQYKMEQRILQEIELGNMPSFCKPENMKAITMAGSDGTQVTFKAAADYIAIGSDTDYIRVPMTPILAQTLARKYGWGLPTGTMTDAIYTGANVKLPGIGLGGHPEMEGIGFIQTHNEKINAQLGPEGKSKLISGEALVAGHKKDVIISRYAIDHPGRLDFRGLYANGKPIQHNPAHEDTYRDYSHGFRPIDGTVTIAYPDGHTETRPYYEALKDPKVAQILNGAEGAIDANKAYNKSIAIA